MQKKILLIKLGNACNLTCSHCHKSNCEYVLNEDIYDFIRDYNPSEIVFSGGEPVLYFKTIKDIVLSLLDLNVSYRFVSNGTLFTQEIVDFLNLHGFYISFSFDGFNGNREGSPDFSVLPQFKKHGLAVTVYKGNLNFTSLVNDVSLLHESFGVRNSFFPNFIHQTISSPNLDMVDDNSVRDYVVFVGKKLEVDFISYVSGSDVSQLPFLKNLLEWFSVKNFRGVRCCSERILNLTLSGDFLLCPYGTTIVGNVYDGVDWDLVESFKPERCKTCNLWNICQNRCIANITDRECKIFKVLYGHYLRLLKKYNLTKLEVLS